MSIQRFGTPQQRIRFSLFAALAIVTTFWYTQYHQSNQPPPSFNQHKQGAEGIMHAITVDEFDQNGNLLSELKAETAYQLHSDTQSDGTPTLFFQYPYLNVYTKDQQHWYVQAQRGTIDKQLGGNSQKIHLTGNVHLTQLAKSQPKIANNTIKHNVITKVTTAYLDIDPKSKQATTNANVTIQQNAQKISGQGLFADLNSGKIRLYSNVHGHFEKIGPNELP